MIGRLYRSTACVISNGTQSLSYRVVSPMISTMFLEFANLLWIDRLSVSFLLLSRTAPVFSWLFVIANSMLLFALHAVIIR